jgi:hypothetical protein
MQVLTDALLMIDDGTAGILRLIGLLGLGVGVCGWALAERSGRRKMLVTLSAGVALFSALIYFIGVMAAADSGASRLLPRFP